MSEENGNPLIHERIVQVMQAMPALGKDGRNKDQGYRFRSIDAICTAVHGLLAQHAIYFIPKMLDSNITLLDRIDRKTGKVFGKYGHAVVKVEYTFYCGDDGSSLVVGPVPGESMDYSDKAYAKAMTFAMKSMLLQTFCIPVQNQLDPDMGDDAPNNKSDPVDDVVSNTNQRQPTKAEAEVLKCIAKRLRTESDDTISEKKLQAELWRLKGTYPNDAEKDVDLCVRYFVQPKHHKLIINNEGK